MKILIVSLSLLFLISTSAVAGPYDPLGGGVLVASAQRTGRKSAPGTVIIKGKGGKVTDVEQKPDNGKKKKKKKNAKGD